jgi:hypothetical protein
MESEAFSDHELIAIDFELSKARKGYQADLDSFDGSNLEDDVKEIYITNIAEMDALRSKIKNLLGY